MSALARGTAAGIGAMLASVLAMIGLIAVFIGDASLDWADRKALTAVVFTLLWSALAAGAAAVGAWQAAEGGADHHAAARLAGVLGPALLIALISVAALAAGEPGAAVVLIEAVIEIAAAGAGAFALARRLDASW